jgi:hypothetical protein
MFKKQEIKKHILISNEISFKKEARIASALTAIAMMMYNDRMRLK